MAQLKLTPERLSAFCAALADTGVVAKACKAVGISRQTAYEWRDEMPDFRARWDKAINIGITALEDEAHRRAFEGTEEPIYHHGTLVGSNTKYSDALAMFLLKAHRPEKYRERFDVASSGSITLNVVTGVPMASPPADCLPMQADRILPRPDDIEPDEITLEDLA